MAVFRAEKKRTGFLVYLDDKPRGPLFRKVLVDMDLLAIAEAGDKTKVLSEIEETRIETCLQEQAFNKAVDFLSRSEYCAKEIYFKLKLKDYAEDIIEEVIQMLYEHRYLNDERYAESYIRSNMRKKNRALILRELEQKNLSLCNVTELFDQVYEDEGMTDREVAENVFRKKFGNADLSDKKTLIRAYNYMIRKGFSYSQVQELLDIKL